MVDHPVWLFECVWLRYPEVELVLDLPSFGGTREPNYSFLLHGDVPEEMSYTVVASRGHRVYKEKEKRITGWNFRLLNTTLVSYVEGFAKFRERNSR